MSEKIDVVSQDTISDVIKPRRIPQFVAKDDLTLGGRIEIFIVKSLAVIFWIYLTTNVFITNVDTIILGRLPIQLVWLVQYKLLVFLTLILVVLWLMPRGRALFYIIYFITFPFVQIMKIPFAVFKAKSWTLGIAFINAIFSIFSDVRSKVIMWICFIFAFVFVVIITNPSMNIIGFLLSAILLLSIYKRAFMNSFKPAELISRYLKVFEWVNTKGRHEIFNVDKTFVNYQLNN